MTTMTKREWRVEGGGGGPFECHIERTVLDPPSLLETILCTIQWHRPCQNGHELLSASKWWKGGGGRKTREYV